MLPYGNIDLVFYAGLFYNDDIQSFDITIIMSAHFCTHSCVWKRKKTFTAKMTEVISGAPKKELNRKNIFLVQPSIQR